MCAFAEVAAMDARDNRNNTAVHGRPPADFPQFQSETGGDVDEVMDTLQQGEHPGAEEVKRIYHQDPTLLDQRADTSDLWQFPEPEQRMVEQYNDHPIGKSFDKICSLIRKHWHVPPRDVVPAEMRPYTPYSLALLLALRRLASNTKQNYEVGQDALLSTWRNRIGQRSGLAFDKSGIQIIQTHVEDILVSPTCCEEIIQETNFGLTLKDVIAATRTGRKPLKGLSAPAMQPTGKLRGGDRGARKAKEKATKGENREKEKASRRDAELAKRQRDLAFLAGHTKIEKKMHEKKKGKLRDKLNGEKGYKLLQFLQGDDDDGGNVYGPDGMAPDAPDGANVAPPNSPEPNTMQPPDSSGRTMGGASSNKRSVRLQHLDPDPASMAPANGLDRHNDAVLSLMFNRVDMDSERELKTRKARKLIEGAAKREGSLPTDRIRLAEIPTLYAQQGMQREAEALAGLGKMGLKGEEQDGGVFGGGAPPAPGKKEVIVLSDDEEL